MGNDGLIFLNNEVMQLVVKRVSDMYENNFGLDFGKMNQKNYSNFLKSYFLSLMYYAPLLDKKEAKKVRFSLIE
jgi:hypothetical protein